MDTNAAELEIIKLWPSIFLERDLADHEAPTRGLIALAESRSDDDVFVIDDPGVEWLKNQIAQAVNAYLDETGYSVAPTWGARGRFETQNFGDYRPLANQPGAHLVGMYVLQWPCEQRPAGARDDGLPGCLTFYDPRIAMNMNAIKRDPYYRYHRHVIPRAGLLIIWPAYVSYFVHPNPSREPAIGIVFDVQLHAPARSA